MPEPTPRIPIKPDLGNTVTQGGSNGAGKLIPVYGTSPTGELVIIGVEVPGGYVVEYSPPFPPDSSFYPPTPESMTGGGPYVWDPAPPIPKFPRVPTEEPPINVGSLGELVIVPQVIGIILDIANDYGQWLDQQAGDPKMATGGNQCAPSNCVIACQALPNGFSRSNSFGDGVINGQPAPSDFNVSVSGSIIISSTGVLPVRILASNVIFNAGLVLAAGDVSIEGALRGPVAVQGAINLDGNLNIAHGGIDCSGSFTGHSFSIFLDGLEVQGNLIVGTLKVGGNGGTTLNVGTPQSLTDAATDLASAIALANSLRAALIAMNLGQ